MAEESSIIAPENIVNELMHFIKTMHKSHISPHFACLQKLVFSPCDLYEWTHLSTSTPSQGFIILTISCLLALHMLNNKFGQDWPSSSWEGFYRRRTNLRQRTLTRKALGLVSDSVDLKRHFHYIDGLMYFENNSCQLMCLYVEWFHLI